MVSQFPFQGQQDSQRSARYRCHLAIVRDDKDSAIVLNLPGIGSCGATPEEAEDSCREAIAGAIASYAAHHEEIPWLDDSAYEVPEGAFQK